MFLELSKIYITKIQFDLPTKMLGTYRQSYQPLYQAVGFINIWLISMNSKLFKIALL